MSTCRGIAFATLPVICELQLLHSARYRPTDILIHRQDSYAPRRRRCTGRREAQSREPANDDKNLRVVPMSIFFSLWLYSRIHALAASVKLAVSLQLLRVDLVQSVGLVGRVISSSHRCRYYKILNKRFSAVLLGIFHLPVISDTNVTGRNITYFGALCC
jgi:hypothetical protein